MGEEEEGREKVCVWQPGPCVMETEDVILTGSHVWRGSRNLRR